jgi:hypothetical protein
LNPLVEGTALALLGRVPAWVDALWRVLAAPPAARPGRPEGARRMRAALDRLGLAEIAREGVHRFARAPEGGPDAARLRFHAVAVVEHALRGVVAARAFATEALAGDERAAAALGRRRAGIGRIERLAAEIEDAGGLTIAVPEDPSSPPPGAAGPAELSADGVGPPSASGRAWLPAPDVADAIVADLALLLGDLAAAAIARFGGG